MNKQFITIPLSENEVNEFQLNRYDYQENSLTGWLDKWYDRHQRLWCIEFKINGDNQIGQTLYGVRDDIEKEYNRLVKSYSV